MRLRLIFFLFFILLSVQPAAAAVVIIREKWNIITKGDVLLLLLCLFSLFATASHAHLRRKRVTRKLFHFIANKRSRNWSVWHNGERPATAACGARKTQEQNLPLVLFLNTQLTMSEILHGASTYWHSHWLLWSAYKIFHFRMSTNCFVFESKRNIGTVVFFYKNCCQRLFSTAKLNKLGIKTSDYRHDQGWNDFESCDGANWPASCFCRAVY